MTHSSPYLIEQIELNQHGDVGGDQIYRLEIHRKYQQKIFDILSDQENDLSDSMRIKFRQFLDAARIIITDPKTTFSPVDADNLLLEIEDAYKEASVS